MVILGLGTNLGDCPAQLRRGVEALGSILTHITCSPIYASRALLPQGAPADWNLAFLNMAVSGETTLEPKALLQEIKTIERALGRKLREHWGPREIDIDILAYDDRVMAEPDLIIPHYALLERDFALIPFADVAPLWVYPIAGPYYGQMASALAGKLPSALSKTDHVI